MKRILIIPLLSFLALPVTVNAQKFTRVQPNPSEALEEKTDSVEEKSLLPEIDPRVFEVRDVEQIISSLGKPTFKATPVNKVLAPRVFSGYKLPNHKTFGLPLSLNIPGLEVMTRSEEPVDSVTEIIEVTGTLAIAGNDTIVLERAEIVEPLDTVKVFPYYGGWYYIDENPAEELDIDIMQPDEAPLWLRNSLTSYRIQEDFIYNTMIANPLHIEYSYWGLPERPKLPEDEVSFASYIKKLDLPEVSAEKAILPDQDVRRIHWLHTANGYTQFSQSYLSSNWYQGGNNHVALRLGANWGVQLNQVFHPNLMFQSNVQYKLGLNSTPQDECHSYSISEDLFQANVNTGIKAFKDWYYSFNGMFKTQFFNSYPNNSNTRKASLLSPGELNLGLGMSYTKKKKDFQITATVSPFSYNLKTVISDKVNHEKFNVPADRKTHSEIGSNGEINWNWNITWNINYTSRLFLFTNYKYFQGDWENKFEFSVNKYLSTQLLLHFRYDTSTDPTTKWKHFMMHEVLSFGVSYTFSTKP